ncbi:MAG: cation-translocating P-type ATPase [Synechococcus sp. ELA619]
MSAAAEAVAPLLLQVEGMKCGGCVRAVEQRLLEQPGVRQASANLMTRTAWVGLDPALEGDPSGPLVEALAGLGFQAERRDQASTPLSRAQRQRQESWWQQWRRLVVALGLLLVSVLGHLSEAGDLPFPLLADIRLHAVVATLALALPGRPILVRGLVGALNGVPSMDTLVGLGMGSAYLASAVALLVPSLGWQCFFNEPVMLLGFVLLGRFIEERARFRTGRALEQLAALQPDTALLVLGDGPPRPVRVGGLRPEDRVLLLPGDRVPVDGLVLEGRSAVDASSLTGEPLPLQAGPGSELAAGSLNLEAPLTLQVLRSGSDSAVARIIALVEEAQARKAPIQGLADRIAGRFSGVVLLLAGATFLFWWQWGTKLWPQVLQAAPSAQAHGGHQAVGMAAGSLHGAAMAPLPLALQLAISVLVVACPCALGLATPAAITVGAGLAARSGLLFRGGDAIEMAASLRSVLFDKTGTITLGRPLVTAVEVLTSASEGGLPSRSEADGLVQIAASLEQHTRHPLAFALLQEAQRRDLALLEVADSRTIAGQGVEGRLQDPLAAGLGVGGACHVGRPGWLVELGLVAQEAIEAPLHRLEAAGATVLAVSAKSYGASAGDPGPGMQRVALVAVQDQPRPDAAASLAELARLGLDLGVLSGDRRSAVEQLARQLAVPLDQLAWELLPQQKLERLLQWRQRGPVAMVGDGINDAPALAAADLGIAVGTGTQIAQDSAGLVVLGDRLEGVVDALLIARRTMAKVRQNLIWAFGYNLVVLPIAAGVLLPRFGLLLSPPLAALLMATSSITVVLNALLLQGPGPLRSRP